MPRTQTALKAIRGRAARVTRLDSCGRVVYGEYNHAVSEGIVTTTFTPNTTETEEVNVTAFTGRRCIYEPSVQELAGYSVDIEFCQVDFELFEIITGQTLVLDADGKVVGLELDTSISLEDKGFALETWTGAVGTDVCDDPDAQGEFGYFLAPYLKGGIVGGIEVTNGAITFTITGASTRDGNRWGNGPYAVELDALGEAGPLYQAVSPTAALRLMVVSVLPPLEAVGARPVLDPTLPEITTVAAVEGDTDMEADFTVTPASTGPVWYDFGDGEWDYVVAPGSASHTYADAGTYTVLASQNGVEWASTTVTVPFAP